MIYLSIFNLIFTCVLAYLFIYKWKKEILNIKTNIENLSKTFEEELDKQTEQNEAQHEMNRLFIQNQGKNDITFINLIDVPFLFEELDPGYQKDWEGEVPFPINEEFIGHEIKLKYMYRIDDVKDKWIRISRK